MGASNVSIKYILQANHFFFSPLYARYATTKTARTMNTMPISLLYSFTLSITASSVCMPGIVDM